MLRRSLLQSSQRTRSISQNFTLSQCYSVQASQNAGIDPSKLTIERTTSPKTQLKPQELVFGRSFTGISIFKPSKSNNTDSLQTTCYPLSGQHQTAGSHHASHPTRTSPSTQHHVSFTTHSNVLKA